MMANSNREAARSESIPSLQALIEVYPDAPRTNNPNQTYSFLESKMRKYADYAGIETSDNSEPLVPILESSNLVAKQIGEDMHPYTGDQVFVREQVSERLLTAAKLLGSTATNARLEVVYGYRALSIQKALFERITGEVIAEGFDGSYPELLETVHRMVAVPDVAGHPTGGAVDVQITANDEPLDMGTPIWEFTVNSYTFSPYITKEAWFNRQKLRGIMVEAGFTPFDGEWWHYSYGDPEWAAATGSQFAIYSQLELMK